MIRTIIQAPKTLCIYNIDTTKQTYALLQKINDCCLVRNEDVTLDLRHVEYISAAASVVLFATINTCQLMSKNPSKVKCIFPKHDINPKGHRYIVKTGLSRALLAGSLEKTEELLRSKNFYQTGVNPVELLVATLEIFNNKLPRDQTDVLISGIGEAMLNVIHHAYKAQGSNEAIDPVKRDIVNLMGERWWQCAWYDENAKAWTFIICDLGLGVAQTYWREMSIVGKELPMQSALQEAFCRGNSRFIGSGRGNGSEDMKRPIDDSAKEELLIYSSGYKYVYNSNMPQGFVLPLGLFFHGTLVQWTLCAEC